MTIETTLPHGLSTSVLGSAYKTEHDANLTALDPRRITLVAPTPAALPAAGIADRFAFVQSNGLLYYDDGTNWVSSGTTGLAGAAGAMLVTLGADQALAANNTTQDVLFDTINYRTGSMANATMDTASGGIIIPAGVTKIKYSARVAFGGVPVGSPLHVLMSSMVNHLNVPSEGASQLYYTPPNTGGVCSYTISSPASIEVVAGDIIDTVFTTYGTTFATTVKALTSNLATSRSWMYIEAIG